MKENSSWLERGVKKRGGEAPSLKLLSPFKQTNYHRQQRELFERG
jgi:hypothetical protein